VKKSHQEIVQSFMHALGVGQSGKSTLIVGDREGKTDLQKADEMGSFSEHFLGTSPPDIFQTDKSHSKTYLHSGELTSLDEQYDLIFAQTPINYKGQHLGISELDGHQLGQGEYGLKCLLAERLSSEGIAFFIVGPRGVWGRGADEFTKRLNELNLFLNGYVELPRYIYRPHTDIPVLLVIVSRQETQLQLFSLVDENPRDVGIGLKCLASGEDLDCGRRVDQFRGFDALRAGDQIERMETMYKGYSTKTFGDLVVSSIKGVKDTPFSEKENCLYLKTGGAVVLATTDVSETKNIPSHIQLQITPDIEPEYLVLFLSSPLGQASIRATQQDASVIRVASLSNLLTLSVPIPHKRDRRAMMDTSLTLRRLNIELEQIRDELVLNPLSGGLHDKLQQMLAVTSAQTEGDRVKTLILKGESKTLEFKQTFQYCVRRKQKEDEIETSALKTLVGFMNVEGGILLIGVEDSGELLGVEVERQKFYKGSNDKFLLRMKDRVQRRIGIDALQDVNMRFIEVGPLDILQIDCKQSKEGTFLDGKDFYVRNTPSTDKLEGKDLMNYLKRRFST
jgi:hypothetical protein